MDSEPDFDVICNVVSILPVEYDVVSEVEDSEEEFDSKDMEELMFYFVTNNGFGDEHKVDEIGINKVLFGGGIAVNLMPQSLLKRIGKTDKDLKPHNAIMSNYEGKAGHSLGSLQVSLTVGTVVKPTLFMVVPLKTNFNLLLGREWIYGIGVVPSSMHQRISIWRNDSIVENIEADQSYFLAEVNQITRKTFDKSLANITRCSSAKSIVTDQAYESSIRLHELMVSRGKGKPSTQNQRWKI